jgi:hypothetical protein
MSRVFAPDQRLNWAQRNGLDQGARARIADLHRTKWEGGRAQRRAHAQVLRFERSARGKVG